MRPGSTLLAHTRHQDRSYTLSTIYWCVKTVLCFGAALELTFRLRLQDLTRTEHGQDLYLQDPFNLPKTLEDALTSHRREAERRGVSLDIVESPTGTPSVLLGDRAKIRITIIKLVENALKHTNHGGILVEWGETSVGVDMGEHAVAKAEDIRIAISVTDTGCGIPDKKIEVRFRLPRLTVCRYVLTPFLRSLGHLPRV